jgi:hypothetical protein
MSKVIYEKILGDTLLYTNMWLQLADSHSATPRDYLKMSLFEWNNHMFL